MLERKVVIVVLRLLIDLTAVGTFHRIMAICGLRGSQGIIDLYIQTFT